MTLPALEVLALLNDYFPPMARAALERGGTLNKYIGDALLAVWGAPFAKADDADSSCSRCEAPDGPALDAVALPA